MSKAEIIAPRTVAIAADNPQRLSQLDGAGAFLHVQRHADDWKETKAMMESWARAFVAANPEGTK